MLRDAIRMAVECRTPRPSRSVIASTPRPSWLSSILPPVWSRRNWRPAAWTSPSACATCLPRCRRPRARAADDRDRAEYDALPDIGHACGHNIIAIRLPGRGGAGPARRRPGIALRVLGTRPRRPAGARGRRRKAGAFAGVHAALMAHPAARDCYEPFYPASSLIASPPGRAAHAAAWPERGVNAADAITFGQVGIGLLRQHILGTDRIHGFDSRRGSAANIVARRDRLTLTSGRSPLTACSRCCPGRGLPARGHYGDGCSRRSARQRRCARTCGTMPNSPQPSRSTRRSLGIPARAGWPRAGRGSTDMGTYSQVIRRSTR